MKRALFIITIFVIAFAFTTKAFALTVSPAKLEVRANPGQQAKGEIEIFNEQEEGKTFYTSFENFESRGDTGAPYFIGSNGGLATWLTSENEIKLEKGERAKVPFSIDIPLDAKPGGYFAAIFFGTEKPKNSEGGEVSIGGKVGVLVLLRVNGDVVESAGLSSFGTKEDKRFFTATPVELEYNFNNVGGDRVVPKGEVIIKNTFRMNTATLLANEKEGSVLPQSTRKFSTTWGNVLKSKDTSFFGSLKSEWNNFGFGWYTATINLTWGESGQTATNTFSFFMFPWHLILVIAIILIVIKIVLSSYKKRIIAQAINAKKN